MMLGFDTGSEKSDWPLADLGFLPCGPTANTDAHITKKAATVTSTYRAEDFMAWLPKLAGREMIGGLRTPVKRSSPSNTTASRAVTAGGENFPRFTQGARKRRFLGEKAACTRGSAALLELAELGLGVFPDGIGDFAIGLGQRIGLPNKLV